MGQVILLYGAPDFLCLLLRCTRKEDTVERPDGCARDPGDLPDQAGPFQPSPDSNLKGALCASPGKHQSVFPLRNLLQCLLCIDNVEQEAHDPAPVPLQADYVVLIREYNEIVIFMIVEGPAVRQFMPIVKALLILRTASRLNSSCFQLTAVMNRPGIPIGAEFLQLTGGQFF